MNLRPRFLLLTLLLFMLVSIPAWLAARAMAESIVSEWAVRYAERQVLYDKARTLAPLLKELQLARQLAANPVLRQWAQDPENPALQRTALQIVEDFRPNFRGQNYFVALARNLGLYRNTAKNDFLGREWRYTLRPNDPEDSWFFDDMQDRHQQRLKILPDAQLDGQDRLWIGIPLTENGERLGLLGTGMELRDLVDELSGESVPGLSSVFVDHKGSVQIHRSQNWINFGSLSKIHNHQRSLSHLFEPDDLRKIQERMEDLAQRPDQVATLFVHTQGERQLVGLSYLPEINWYKLTLIDLDELLPLSNFYGLIAICVLTLVAVLVLYNLALSHYVVRPLSLLDRAMSSLEQGQQMPRLAPGQATGEIAELIRHFRRLDAAVTEARSDLEEKVKQRTAALERLARLDPMTTLLNRRGMLERLRSEVQRAQGSPRRLGLLWIEVAQFKYLNERYGFSTGDRALKTVAHLLEKSLESSEVASRWGGDEFLMLVAPGSQEQLEARAQRLIDKVAAHQDLASPEGKPLALSIAVGCYLSHEGDSLDDLLQHCHRDLQMRKGLSTVPHGAA